MSPLWLQIRRAATVLLVALVLGHAQFALACTRTSWASKGMPCCPMSGQNSTGAEGSCAGATVCVFDCAATLQAAYDQAGQTARAVAPEIHNGQGVHLLAPVWPEPPVAAHQKPPPQGPPITLLAALTGRHTYLATLRLRI